MASYSFTITVTSTPSTSVVFTPVGDGTFVGPVAPGTVMGTVTVEPSDWSGVLAVNAPFAMSGNDVVNSTLLEIGTYSIAGSSNP